MSPATNFLPSFLEFVRLSILFVFTVKKAEWTHQNVFTKLYTVINMSSVLF